MAITPKSGWGVSGKTFWEWIPNITQILQALAAIAIPLTVFFGTQWYSNQQSQTSLRIASDQQQQTVLENYLDRISNLLLNDNLHTSKRGDEVQKVAQVWTLTALHQLDSARKGALIKFLFYADLIGVNNPIVTVNKADNPIIVLDTADLTNIDLSGMYLVGIDIHDTFLTKANFSYSLLNFDNISISDVGNADFSYATLINANLSGSYLLGDSFAGADLSKANLRGAKVTNAQLAKVKSLKGAIMPNGSVHP